MKRFLIALLVVAGCKDTPKPTPPTPPAGDSSLIPRSVLFGPPARTSVQISPDGKYLSFLAPKDGLLNVWVAPIDDPAAAKVITQDKTRPVRSYNWAYNSSHILYSQDTGGDENWQIFAVNVTDGSSKNLVDNKKVAARIGGMSPKFPNEVIILKNDRDPKLHDPYRVNIETGASERILENIGFVGWVIDDDFKIRYAARPTPFGGMQYVERAPKSKMGWKPAINVGPKDAMTTSPLGFDDQGRLLLRDSRDRNTAAFYRIGADGKKSLIAEHAKADGAGLLQHPQTKKVLAATFVYAKREYTLLDDSIKADEEKLAKLAGDNEYAVSDTDMSFRKWIVVLYSDTTPAKYYLWDRDAQKSTFLFDAKPKLANYKLAKMQTAVIKARDGLEMVGYYTVPTDAAGKASPTVLLVHGGPWARDNWGYNKLHQLLANRGYAVVSVNFRGSTGFGKAHLNAGNREWGKKMHTDLLDTVNWAVEQGIADKDKVCIMGGSYGGYATLAGLTLTPDAFTCGVDIVGPSNIMTLLESVPPYWAPLLAMFKQRVGDWTTEEGKKAILDVSPITHVEKIKKPLLIGQGANDPRVKQAESDQIVAAMKKRNIPVSYALFPDEGHGFAKPENNVAFFAVVEAFLAKNLGGQYQPITKRELEESTMQIKAGPQLSPM